MDEAERRARWEGEVEARVKALETQEDQTAGDVAKLIEIVVALKTKVGIYSALGGLIGSGVVTAFATGIIRHP